MRVLEQLREWEAGRTQWEMAVLLGISQAQYSRIRAGVARPSEELARAIHQKSRGRVPLKLWGELGRRRGVGPRAA